MARVFQPGEESQHLNPKKLARMAAKLSPKNSNVNNGELSGRERRLLGNPGIRAAVEDVIEKARRRMGW